MLVTQLPMLEYTEQRALDVHVARRNEVDVYAKFSCDDKVYNISSFQGGAIAVLGCHMQCQ